MDRFAVDWRTAGLDPVTRALCAYAERLTLEPAAAGAEWVPRLKALGLSETAVSSATQVVAYFNYINRIAEGLGVDHEDWIDELGRPR